MSEPDFVSQMNQTDQQILQLFVKKLDLAKQDLQHKQAVGEKLFTRGEDAMTLEKQIKTVNRPEYDPYLIDLMRDLTIITRQSQANIIRKQQK